jgi:hypothetical protein
MEADPTPQQRWQTTGRAGRRTLPIGALVLALVVALLATPSTEAAFTAGTGNGGSSWAAACLFRPTVQSGTTTNAVNGTTTVTITAVDPARSFLLFSTRHNSNRPVGSQIGGRLASSTSVQFIRVTDQAPPNTITIQWSVITYPCGISVQRGVTPLTATTIDVPITPVASIADAFVTYSKTPTASDVTWDENDPATVRLIAPGTVRIAVDAAVGDHNVYWQVVEFTDPTKIHVQRGTRSLGFGTGSTTATLPTAVDPTRTFVLVSTRSPGGSVSEVMVRARLTNSTTITFDRLDTGGSITEIAWEAIELLDGSTVRSGSAAFGSGTTTLNATIAAVDTARSTAFSGVQNGSGQNAGRHSYNSDDITGVGSATLALSSATQVTLTRANNNSSADIGWFVVTWGNP